VCSIIGYAANVTTSVKTRVWQGLAYWLMISRRPS